MNFKFCKTIPLIITILLLSAFIDFLVVKHISPFLARYFSASSHIRVPTTVSLLGMFFYFYDVLLWKLPIFKLLMNVPNMSGRYVGKIKYELNGNLDEKNCVIEVSQKASQIKVHTYFNNKLNEMTSSKSLVEDIKMEEDNFYDIYFFYLNSGSKQNGELDCHEGANKLRYFPNQNGNSSALIGHYFTNRQIQTRGEIETFFVSKKLQGRF